jgi:glutamate--cysteine ligase
VSDHDPRLDVPIKSEDDLYSIFREAEKPRARWVIGAEMEKFGVLDATGDPISYEGDHGVLRVMSSLEPAGWVPQREHDGGPVIALLRGAASVTLEPGCQLELSGAPLDSVHAICTEFRRHIEELGPVSKELGIRWMGLGFHPFAKRSDLSMVPKDRYGIMREYLPTRGAHALDMMLRTCTVQANFDYSDERDAMRKMRVGLKLSPLTTAIFANSPFYEGAPHGGLTYRGRVWLDVDPDRSGLLPGLWKEGSGYADYVEWALGVPMFVVKRETEVIPNTGQTFRAFLKDGRNGYRATLADWQTHVNTLFPEVRLKRTIEIRGADAQGNKTRCALPALWTGIYYDEGALAAADALTADWKHDEVSAIRPDVARLGVRAVFRGQPMVALAQRVLEIAEGGLERRARKRADGKDERIHLAELRSLLEKGRSPADALLDGIDKAPDFRREVMARADLEPRKKS